MSLAKLILLFVGIFEMDEGNKNIIIIPTSETAVHDPYDEGCKTIKTIAEVLSILLGLALFILFILEKLNVIKD